MTACIQTHGVVRNGQVGWAVARPEASPYQKPDLRALGRANRPGEPLSQSSDQPIAQA